MDDLLREFLTETNESLDRVDAELVLDLQSAAGVGTAFTIKIPLTLAIVSSLLVEAGGERFAMPQLSVLELVQAGNGEHRIERIKDTPVLRLRKKLLPLIYLKEMLRLGDRASGDCFVVVSGRQRGFRHRGRRRVTHRGNRDQADVVEAAPHRGVLRHTILGDGSVIMIIDLTE